VPVRMPGAFRRTGPAEGDAGGELRFQRLPVTCLIGAGHDAAGCSANSGAVQIQADTGDQAFHMLFRQAGVGASRAGFDAKRTGVDARSNGVGVGRMLRMGAKHGAHD